MSFTMRAAVIGMLVVLASTGATRAADESVQQKAQTAWLGYRDEAAGHDGPGRFAQTRSLTERS